MNLLPEIENGILIMSREEQKLVGVNSNIIPEARRSLLKENLEKIKAKKLEDELRNADAVAAEMNNDGRPEISADFSDSPFADRQPLASETE